MSEFNGHICSMSFNSDIPENVLSLNKIFATLNIEKKNFPEFDVEKN